MARKQPESASVRVLYARLAEEQALIAQHEANVKDLKSALSELIKPNDTVDGIRHSFTERTNIKWAEASKTIVENLVPKTKRPKAAQILMQFSSVTAVSRFLEVK